MLSSILLSSLLLSTTPPKIIKPIEISPYDVSPSTEGTAIVECKIDELGEGGEVNIVDTFDITINPLIEKAVRRMKFEPALQNGNPVRVMYSLPIRFE